LKELQMRGLIHRKQFAVVPPKVEYTLSVRGNTLVPILNAIVAWGMTGIHEEILAGEISRVAARPSSRVAAKNMFCSSRT